MTMATGRGSRDRVRRVEDEEVEQGGRPSSFDGNHTGDTTGWLVLPAGRSPSEADWDVLVEWLIAGHLAWFVFPTQKPELDL